MTNREQSVLDDIDALVDEQMAGGEPIGGYDYNDPDYPKCPHCHRSWHGLAITQRIEGMAWRGVMDPDYRYAEDDSPVLCPGSDFIGPVATPEQLHWIRSSEETKRRFPDGRIPTVQEMLSAAMALYGDLYFATNPFVRNEIPVYPSARAREVAWPEMSFRPNWWYDHGEISGADTAVTPDRPYRTGLGIREGDRVAYVLGDRRYEGTVTSVQPETDPNRPWIISEHLQVTDVREVTNEIRGFTTGPVIFDEVSALSPTPRRNIGFRGGRIPEWLITRGRWTLEVGDGPANPTLPTPQERALPRPADQPPMWANDPARTRRTRNRARSIRTPRV